MSETESHPAAATQTRDGTDLELLSFKIAEQEYSVNIMSVREIRGWTRATSLPHAPGYVHGVINLRGAVLPVIDLALRLGIEAEAPSERSVIIVVDLGARTIGLRVDAVSDILAIPETALQPPPDLVSEPGGAFVRALTIIDGRMIRVLDLEAVLPADAVAA